MNYLVFGKMLLGLTKSLKTLGQGGCEPHRTEELRVPGMLGKVGFRLGCLLIFLDTS